MKQNNKQQCPGCGGSLQRGIRPRDIRFNGYTKTFDQPAWYCNTKDCNNGILDPEDVDRWDIALSRIENPSLQGGDEVPHEKIT